MDEYTTKVCGAVTKLIELAYSDRFGDLSLNLHEECPSVSLWMGSKGIAVRVYGNHVDEKSGWIMPQENDSWNFLECCEKVIAEVEGIRDVLEK